MVPRRKPAQPAPGAPPDPEDGAPAPAAPATRDQLAAVPDRPEATDALLSRLGRGAAVPTDDKASLEAVERLLRGREAEFSASLDAYLTREWPDWPHCALLPRKTDIVETLRVLGQRGDRYRVLVMLDPSYRMQTPNMGCFGEVTLTLKIDGEDFEIVGHAFLSDEAREPAAARPGQVRSGKARRERAAYESGARGREF